MRYSGTALVAVTVAMTPGLGRAEMPLTLTARLSPVPINVTQQSTIAGAGQASVVITGRHAEIRAAFKGLPSPATDAQIHLAPKGLRGPAILDLPVIREGDGRTGSIAGGFDLTPAQRTDLIQGRWYVQLGSEKAPDGTLWGWLLPKDARP